MGNEFGEGWGNGVWSRQGEQEHLNESAHAAVGISLPTSKKRLPSSKLVSPAREKPLQYCIFNALGAAILKLIDASKGGTDLSYKQVDQ